MTSKVQRRRNPSFFNRVVLFCALIVSKTNGFHLSSPLYPQDQIIINPLKVAMTQNNKETMEETKILKQEKNNHNNNNSNGGKNKNRNNKKYIGTREEYGGDDENLIYRSGIPTLRSSAHRVKFKPKNRKHDPNPKDQDGKETKTTWLPKELIVEDVFKYDPTKYDLRAAVISILKSCNPEIVGQFKTKESDSSNDDTTTTTTTTTPRLEDFTVPVSSLWRSVNGGCCEDAQKYLSDAVTSNDAFLTLFDQYVQEVILPYLKQRLIDAGAVDADQTLTVYYQRPPTLRLQPGPAWAKVKPHNDAEYGHQNGELNFWIPLTDRIQTGVDLWNESSFNVGDYHPVPAAFGEAISFHGSSCRHYVNTNSSPCTRVSMDFRVGVQGFFDPYWQMRGTTDDHGRKEASL